MLPRTVLVSSIVTLVVLTSTTGCGSGAAAEHGPTAPGTTATQPARTTEAPSPAPSFADAALHAALDQLTAYDAAAPLGDRVQRPATEASGGVRVTDLAYASPAGGDVSAWLVEPPTSVPGPYAALVYVHGSETTRDDLRDEAVAMATVGVVSLVLDAPFARPSGSARRHLQNYEEPDLERDMMAQAVVDARRAFDYLVARPDVDPARVGYVGHSWGASLGTDVAAVDDRATALVMITPRPSWTGFLATSDDEWVTTRRRIVGEQAWLAYLTALAPFDALAQVGRVPGDRVLLQYGEADDVVPVEVGQLLVDALPAGATTQWYQGVGHALDDTATADRCAWLADRFGLPAVSALALAEVGLPDQ